MIMQNMGQPQPQQMPQPKMEMPAMTAPKASYMEMAKLSRMRARQAQPSAAQAAQKPSGGGLVGALMRKEA